MAFTIPSITIPSITIPSIPAISADELMPTTGNTSASVPSKSVGSLMFFEVSALKATLAKVSGGSYTFTSANGIGKYVTNASTLIAAGYVNANTETSALSDDAVWTGKDGFTGAKVFLDSPDTQEQLIETSLKQAHNFLSSSGVINKLQSNEDVAGLLFAAQKISPEQVANIAKPMVDSISSTVSGLKDKLTVPTSNVSPTLSPNVTSTLGGALSTSNLKSSVSSIFGSGSSIIGTATSLAGKVSALANNPESLLSMVPPVPPTDPSGLVTAFAGVSNSIQGPIAPPAFPSVREALTKPPAIGVPTIDASVAALNNPATARTANVTLPSMETIRTTTASLASMMAAGAQAVSMINSKFK